MQLQSQYMKNSVKSDNNSQTNIYLL